MGRLLTFVARVMTENVKSVQAYRGIGVDEHTALLLDTVSGAVQTVGVGTAYVCYADHKPEVCKDKTPLTFRGKCLCDVV